MPPLNRNVMRHKSAVAIGVGAAMAAGFLALVYVERRREPPQDTPELAPPSASVPLEVPSSDVENGAAARDRRVVSLRDMSPSFLHSTLLIAIRYAGFYCEDVVAAQESGDGIWIANCADAREYKLSARLTDALSVEAIYFDAPLRLGREPAPVQQLETQRLKQ